MKLPKTFLLFAISFLAISHILLAQETEKRAGAEMDVRGNGKTIVDGDAAPAIDDHTDFGLAPLDGSANVVRLFTIVNIGDSDLNLTGSPAVAIGGLHPADFTVTLQPTVAIGPGAGTTFQITFFPLAVGVRSATVSISNNDSNENPYNFSIKGTGSGAEMDVKGNSKSIADGDTSPSLDDHTDFGNVVLTGGTLVRTFTLFNTGNANLQLTGSPLVSIGGSHASDFVVSSLPITPVKPGSSTTFKVTFDPSATGVRFATITIPNNDNNENPYDFAIKGTGTAPEMDVQGNGQTIANGDNTPSASDHTDFGNVLVSGGTLVRTFTIANTGTSNLNLTGTIRVSITGTNASEFVVTAQPVTPVIPGGMTPFKITFDPKAGGMRSATVKISNNDSDENPYQFAIQGTGTEPEMDVRGNGRSIVDGDSTPSADDHTHFGNVQVNGETFIRTFTIANTGNGTLNLTGTTRVVIGGTHAGDFKVTAQPMSPLTPSGTTTFQITFDPAGMGARNATISIANNDANENPYNFAIQGTGTAPEMDVRGLGKSILDGDTTPAADDHTDFGSVLVNAGTVVRTFTIANTGNGNLELTGVPVVTITGTNGADFTVTIQPTTPVGPQATMDFEISFDPSVGGIRTATVNIANSDSNENPYNFAIKGVGALGTAPEMEVQGNGKSIADGDTSPDTGDHTDFGNAETGSGTVVRVFTIANTGNMELNLTGSPKVTISGPNAADFSVTAMPVTPVAASGTTNFEITFDPSAMGIRFATVSIASDDANENPYDFKIQGKGVEFKPEMNVQGNGTTIADGDTTPSLEDHTDFGDVELGNELIRTFTIHNMGLADLNLTGTPKVAMSGSSEFSVTTQPSTPVASNDSTIFQIRFYPMTRALKTATVSIGNDDGSVNPYDFSIQGNSTGTRPEMQVKGKGVEIADGDATPSTADDTDFGEVWVGKERVMTFAIHNLGDADLILNGTPLVYLNGSSDFKTIAMPTSPILPGQSTTFQIQFKPMFPGLQSTIVTIANNDSDENPYDFKIQGIGIAAGSLDSTFGTNGNLVTIGGGPNSIMVQPDGKIVVLDGTRLIRCTVGGALDTSFGTNGVVELSGYRSVAAQSDNKIVVAGAAASDFIVARYNNDGTLDTTFGTNGSVTTDLAGYVDDCYSVVIQPDGKIVAVGYAGNGSGYADMALVRYQTDGTLDNTFGSNGKVIKDMGGSEYLYSLALRPDGRIVAAGSGSYTYLVFCNTNGTLSNWISMDKSSFSIWTRDRIVSVRQDGKMVVGGFDHTSGNMDYAVMRYYHDGSRDKTFGTDGKARTDFFGGHDSIDSMALQTDGKIVAVGHASNRANQYPIVRYNNNGTLDSTFGSDGIVFADFSASRIAIQTDGKIIAVGGDGNGNRVIARYLSGMEVTCNLNEKNDHIEITWETPAEENITGYHLWRTDKMDGEYERITGFPIPAQGSKSHGSNYLYTDFSIVPSHPYWYKIECVYGDNALLHGPFTTKNERK